jgi:hypothetical protein
MKIFRGIITGEGVDAASCRRLAGGNLQGVPIERVLVEDVDARVRMIIIVTGCHADRSLLGHYQLIFEPAPPVMLVLGEALTCAGLDPGSRWREYHARPCNLPARRPPRSRQAPSGS